MPGIFYLLKDRVVRNDLPEQIKNLDEIPFPAYHLVDIKSYLRPINDDAVNLTPPTMF